MAAHRHVVNVLTSNITFLIFACAVSRDQCVGGNFSHIFEIPDPNFPIHYTTFMALWH